MNTYIVSVVLIKNLGTGQSNIANSVSEVKAISEEEAKGKALTQVSKDFPGHQISTMLAVLINPNPWQQAIDDELINAHLGIAKDEITREEAKAELNKLIAWHIDVAKYFDSQAQQTESQWISVDKCLPDGDRFVDVFVKSRSNLAYGTRFTEFRFINGVFDVSSLPSACYVSHWMPLPPAPEGGE